MTVRYSSMVPTKRDPLWGVKNKAGVAMEDCKPWEHPLSIWKTKSQYFVWLRGHLRNIWKDYPLRTEWKKTQLRPVRDEERKRKVFHPSTKSVGTCYLCNNWFAGSKLEVDHKVKSNGCYDFDTAEEFLWHCAADDSSNWALVCKPCHKIKSHAEGRGITFEDAKAEKKAIEILNKKQDKQFLLDRGIKPAANQKLRRNQLVGFFKGADTCHKIKTDKERG